MPTFSQTSLKRLSTCNIDLQTLFKEVIKTFDCIVIEGHRGKDAQDEAFKTGKSKLKYPNGKHNAMPSHAVDVAPYNFNVKGIDWKDYKTFYLFSGYVLGIANQLKIQGMISHSIRWGGDWDCDMDIHDQTFNDLVHFEIVL